MFSPISGYVAAYTCTTLSHVWTHESDCGLAGLAAAQKPLVQHIPKSFLLLILILKYELTLKFIASDFYDSRNILRFQVSSAQFLDAFGSFRSRPLDGWASPRRR